MRRRVLSIAADISIEKEGFDGATGHGYGGMPREDLMKREEVCGEVEDPALTASGGVWAAKTTTTIILLLPLTTTTSNIDSRPRLFLPLEYSSDWCCRSCTNALPTLLLPTVSYSSYYTEPPLTTTSSSC